MRYEEGTNCIRRNLTIFTVRGTYMQQNLFTKS